MGETLKYYDLTLSQNLMFFALKYSTNKSIVNIGTSFWFEEDIDIDLLENAIYICINRIDALRLRLIKVNKVYKQYISSEKPKQVMIEDFSSFTESEVNKRFQKWTSTAMKYNDCEAYEFKIIKGPENKVILYVKVNHVFMDAWGLTVFGKDLLDVYCALKLNEELPQSPKQFLPIIEKELEYKGSERYNKDFEFWKQFFYEKPIYSAINKKYVGKPYRNILFMSYKSKLKVYTLPKDKVDIIKKYCLENKLSPQILFILASKCYFNMINNNEDVVITNVAGRRSSMNTKLASGMLINLLLFRLNGSNNVTFIDACNNLTEQQFSLFRHADFPYERVLDYIKKEHFNGKKLISFNDMSLTYQMGKIKSDKEIKYRIKNHSNGVSGAGVYLTIMDAADLGTLDFLFEYNLSIMNEEAVSQMYYEILKIIEIGINSPNSTLDEIMIQVNDDKNVNSN